MDADTRILHVFSNWRSVYKELIMCGGDHSDNDCEEDKHNAVTVCGEGCVVDCWRVEEKGKS